MKTEEKQSEKELSKQFEKDMIEVGDCTVLCLKHEPGPLTLTVNCNGVEKQITVYTRR